MNEEKILKQTMYIAEKNQLEKQLYKYKAALEKLKIKCDNIESELYKLKKNCQHINLDGTNTIVNKFAYDTCSICGKMW